VDRQTDGRTDIGALAIPALATALVKKVEKHKQYHAHAVQCFV